MAKSNEAAHVLRPGRGTAKGGVYSRVFSTTSVTYAVPAAWKGFTVRIATKTAEVQVAFASSDVGDLTANQVSTLATITLTPVNGTGMSIPAGGFLDYDVASDDSHFEVISGDGVDGQWFVHVT